MAFGYLTMMNNEDYWTTEFPIYVDILFEKINSETLSETLSENIVKSYCKKPEIDLSWIKNPEILEITKDDMEVHDANRL